MVNLVVIDKVGYVISSEPMVVNVNPPLSFIFNLPNAIDTETSKELKINISGGTSPFTIFWYINGTLVGQNSTNILFSPILPGYYKIDVTVVDAVGSMVSSSKEINVNSPPSVELISPAFTDVGKALEFLSNVKNGSQPYSIYWYINGTIMSSNTTSFRFVPSSPGRYNVNVTAIDAAGVVASSSKEIIVNPYPRVSSVNISLKSSSVFYSNDIVVINVDVSGGTPPYNFILYINGKAIELSTSQIGEVKLALGENTIKIIATDAVESEFSYGPINVTASYNYLLIAGISLGVTGAIAILYFVLRRHS